MRYRSFNTAAQFSGDLAAYADLVGGDYLPALKRLGDGLNHKGYVTETDDLRFSLELQLLNLEVNRRLNKGIFSGMPTRVYEAIDFVIGIGQALPHLSEKARGDLRSEIVTRIKNKQGLRPLQHEFRIAGALSQFGYDVTFADLEGGQGGFDFLAQGNDHAFEVEGKCVPAFLGQAILPEAAEIFFLALAKDFHGWSDETSIPILTINLFNRLDTNQAMISKLVAACNRAARTRAEEVVEGYATVKFIGAVPESSADELFETMQIDSVATWANVFLSEGQPRVAVRLESERPSRFARSVLDNLSDAANRQFTGTRPGVIWLHMDYAPPEIFDALANANTGASFLDLLALAVLNSPKRSHICQLVVSGGAHLMRRGEFARSGFRRVVYNSPCCRFGDVRLFSPGKTINSSTAMAGPKAKSLLAEANIRFRIAAGPKEAFSAAQKQLLLRYATSTSQAERLIGANTLFGRALQLGQQGRSGQAIEAYDELISLFGTSMEEGIDGVIAASLFNRGNMLGDLGRGDEALSAYESVVTRFSVTTRPDIAEKIARALFNSGRILGSRPDRVGDAIGFYRQIFDRFKAAPRLYREEIVAQALVNLGGLLGLTDEAVLIFDEVIARFGTSKEEGLREQVEKAFANKASAHMSNGRSLEALATLDSLLARPEKSMAGIELRITFWKMDVLLSLGREAEALELCDRMMQLIRPTSDLSLKEQLASALLSKASVLKGHGNVPGELETYNALIAEFGAYPDDGLLRRVILAEQKKIETLTSLERYDDAILTCDSLVLRFDRNGSLSDLKEIVAWALFFKGVLQGLKHEPEKAVDALSEAIRRFGLASATRAENAGRALVERAGHLCDLGRYDEAFTDCDEFLAGYDVEGETEASEFVAQALLIKGISLANMDKATEAIGILEEIAARFSGKASEPLACYVEQAVEILKELRRLNDET
jgi:tetratricopeptide (TPR) repeat protein